MVEHCPFKAGVLGSSPSRLTKIQWSVFRIHLGGITAAFETSRNNPRIENMDKTLYLSASEMARAVREKKISSLELVRAHLERIESVNPKLNAVVQIAAERALAEARQSDAALVRGETRGPLHGVPFTLKDAIETAGVITTGGTAGRRRFVPSEDATVVKRLRGAGGILLGKTNCPEFGWAWESDNLIYGRTNNPFDLSLSPGGSSGGESAIIASGGSPFGLGSDAGGSVRFPAHCTGICAIKPTSGRVPRTGHFPGPGGTLDTIWQIGPLARYVEDLALVLHIISGPDGRDAAIVPMPLGAPAKVDLKDLRVAFFTDNGIVPPTKETIETVRAAAEKCSSEVAAVEEIRPPAIEQTYEIYLKLFSADGGAGLEGLIKAAGTNEVHPLMKRVLEIQRANAMTMAEFGALVGRWDEFKTSMLGFMEKFDAIISPVCSFPGMVHGSTYDVLPSFSYTMTHNLTGWPAAVVRAGNAPNGLPIGVQIAARPWREDVALAIAAYLESALGGPARPAI
jgi:amidase